ncbi:MULTISPECIES: HK97 family phage prohead protease [Kordiimonas]|jgi:hypothetical protein|uniref:HK97 family phage prohead protease n=1 Tax=Kordiimonas TaxID=288021 RepID=UPI00257A4A78|nr:HK97 family phage prohead protease [Kordiimonas sp. UBA4487]
MAASQTMTREMAAVPLEVKATDETGENGTFEGYGAIFGNLDRDGDVVARGAFGESLKGRMPALLWQHNAKEPIGRFDVVREDARGLYVKGRLSMEGRGREAYELLKMGALDGLSIGFVTREASRDAASGTRTITRAELMEISLVTFPANELARVTGVKSQSAGLPETPRDFERMLRSHGISRSRAKAITARGLAPLDGTPDHTAIANIVGEVKARQAALERKEDDTQMIPAGRRKAFSFTPFSRVSDGRFSIEVFAAGNSDTPLDVRLTYAGGAPVAFRVAGAGRKDFDISTGLIPPMVLFHVTVTNKSNQPRRVKVRIKRR